MMYDVWCIINGMPWTMDYELITMDDAIWMTISMMMMLMMLMLMRMLMMMMMVAIIMEN